ncbi:hypothetical protein [Nocardia puris]|nr:hypothetical protein [Nocardia puris]
MSELREVAFDVTELYAIAPHLKTTPAELLAEADARAEVAS